MKNVRFVDLFCGIGGFHLAAQQACKERQLEATCVFASDIDTDCQKTYEANFHQKPAGDICAIPASAIPDHDLLFAGFPCQPFSIIGSLKGFEDTRGTLFFEIVRILEARQPRAFVLENVKQLTGHDNGRTLKHIMQALAYLGYHAQYKVLNALDFGLPQKRERVFIVGFREPIAYKWPTMRVPMRPLEDLLQKDVAEFYHASSMIRANRLASHAATYNHYTIWHENKGGHISAYPYSCALRAGASYNYLLVNGERRLTEREMLRLQGFPDTHQIVCGYAAMRKLTGNSVAVPVVKAVVSSVLDALQHQPHAISQPIQGTLLDLPASITM